jgi:glutathione S-transferase
LAEPICKMLAGLEIGSAAKTWDNVLRFTNFRTTGGTWRVGLRLSATKDNQINREDIHLKLFNSIGPNPRVVKMFMAEKGISIPMEEVDLMGGANREADYLKVNPAGQLPALQLDNGDIISEITNICEYLEEKNPSPVLIGSTAEERAETRMWVRRIDLGICEPLANGFRYSEGLPMFQSRMRCIPEAADGLKACAQDKIEWIDGQLEGKQWIAGDRFSLADILLFSFLDFGVAVGQPVIPDNKNVVAWFERTGARPSAAASA